MTGSNRYLDVSSQSVWHWLSQARSPERDLIAQLLAADPRQPFALDVLARAMGQTLRDTGRLLFAMNRRAALSIATSAPPARPQNGLDEGLALALQQLVETGGILVLADSDGLLLAHAGCSTAAAERVAAGLGNPDHFAVRGTLHLARQRVKLYVAGPVQRKHPAWVALARLLQKRVGALSIGRPA
jgi:hypothetical protein